MFAKALILLLLLTLVAVTVFTLRRREQSVALKITAVAIALALGVPLLIVLYYHSTYSTIDGFVANIAETFGWSSKFAAGVTILLIVPTTYASGLLLSLNSKRRSTGTIMFAVGLACYYFILDAGTRDNMVSSDGGQLKCYTISTEGVRYFEKQQVDPRTGEMCQWVNQENLRYVQRLDEKLKSGEPIRRIPETEYADLRLFATGTNGPIPLVWFFKAKDGTIELFDAPGVHPIYGVNLQPMNTDIAQEWTALVKRTVPKPEVKSTESAPKPTNVKAPEPTPELAKTVNSTEGSASKKDLSVDYFDVKGEMTVAGLANKPTRFKVIVRSVKQSPEDPRSFTVDFSACNVGTVETYYPVTIYFTDKNSHSILWEPEGTTNFPIGWCENYVREAKLSDAFAGIDFQQGTFFVKDSQHYFLLPIVVVPVKK